MSAESSDYLTARAEAAGSERRPGAAGSGGVPHACGGVEPALQAGAAGAAAVDGSMPAAGGRVRQGAAAAAASGWHEWGSAATAGRLPHPLPPAAAADGMPAAAGGVGEGMSSPFATAPHSAAAAGGTIASGSAGSAAGSGMPPADSGSAPHPAADYGSHRLEGPSLSVAEAARQVGIPERTLRAWIGEGRVPAFRPDPTRRGMRLPLSALEALRQRAAESGSLPYGRGSGLPHAAADGGADAAVQVLEAKLDGAQAAVRLHAQRRHEEREQHREERARLEEELAFLRERMVKAEEAERELRILLAQQTQASQQAAHALQALTEKPALPPPALPPPPRVRWWMPWKRG